MSKIEVFYQEAAELQTDVSLKYVKSGLEEIKQFVKNNVKPNLELFINDTVKPDLEDYAENTLKDGLATYAAQQRQTLSGYVNQAKEYSDAAQLSATSAAASASQAAQELGYYYTKTQVDELITTINNQIGNIGSVLDNINGEVENE